MKCSPDQSAAQPHSSSQTSAAYQRSGVGSAAHQPAEQPAHRRKHDEEARLAADARPVHENDGEHAPDGDIVEARVAQHALADRLAQDRELLHQQYQDRQCGHRARHADPEHELPVHGACTDPSGVVEQHRRRGAAEQQRHTERQRRGGHRLTSVPPGLFQIELDRGDAHEHHHRPPGDAVQQRDHRRTKHEAVVVRQHPAEGARAEQHAGDDLHDHQRRVVIGAQQPPDQVGHRVDDAHRQQEHLGVRHGAAPVSGLTQRSTAASARGSALADDPHLALRHGNDHSAGIEGGHHRRGDLAARRRQILDQHPRAHRNADG